MRVGTSHTCHLTQESSAPNKGPLGALKSKMMKKDIPNKPNEVFIYGLFNTDLKVCHFQN